MYENREPEQYIEDEITADETAEWARGGPWPADDPSAWWEDAPSSQRLPAQDDELRWTRRRVVLLLIALVIIAALTVFFLLPLIEAITNPPPPPPMRPPVQL